jgi:hypothetical protein
VASLVAREAQIVGEPAGEDGFCAHGDAAQLSVGPGLGGSGEVASSQVSIGGAWDGRVRVETSLVLARQLTAHMFDLAEEDVDDDLVADAIGEIANIIGGNVKALLPTPSHLGLPGPGGGEPAEEVARAVLNCDDHLVVVVVERLLQNRDSADSGWAVVGREEQPTVAVSQAARNTGGLPSKS